MSVKRILLIDPFSGGYENASVSSSYNAIPLGMGYVGAYLKKQNHEVKFIGLFNKGFKKEIEIQNIVRTFSPDYVGVGGLTKQYPSAMKVVEYVKAVNNSIITVYGGIHATAMPEYCMRKNPCLDFIVKGEGEQTFSELANLDDLSKCREINGLVFRKGNSIIENPLRELVQDLDSFPFPWSVINPLDYRNGFVDGGIYKEKPVAPIITTRGCVYKCTYCGARIIAGPKIRRRSPENVVDEIEFLISNFGIKE